MQSAAETVENASILSGGSAQDGHRLWIGNIDPKITDIAFVTIGVFCPSQEAERAIQCLNGKLALSKKLVVRWAHAQKFEPFRGDKNVPASLEPSSSEAEELPTTLGVNAKIRAIEAKLQLMEENPDDYSGPSAYIYNKPPDKRDKRSQPYYKPFRRFRR
uniref:RNA binding motif protein 18 n=1 Tax=Cyprinus carpio TaxID=7962 RepID=A0A8C2D751_CYPCA